MMDLEKEILKAFNRYAREGVDAFKSQHENAAPELSHLCLKFGDMPDYDATVVAAGKIGTVMRQQFNGKEIAWCHLQQPLRGGNISVEWLEMVEPKLEKNPFSGVSSLGYRVADLPELVKIQSGDDRVLFRYLGRHVHP